MKLSRGRFLTVVLLVLGLAAQGFSAEASGTDLSRVTPDQQRQDASRQSFVDARSRLDAGNEVEAEAALASGVTAPANTALWGLELAQRLVQTAGDMAKAGKPELARALAVRALRQIQAAAALPTDNAGRIALRNQAGFIYERYLADPEAAKAAYREAAALAPGESAAKDKLQRIEAREANVARRVAEAEEARR